MRQILKYAGYILVLIVAGYLIWRFSYMIAWVLAAAMLSFVGHPLVRFFDSFRFRKLKIPHPVSALLALVIILGVMLGILAIFVPLIVSQANTIAQIDVNRLAANLQGPLQWIDQQLHLLGAIPDNLTLQEFLVEKAKSVVNLGNVSGLLNNIFSVAGNIFVGIFSIFFIAFFFLKDDRMFEELLLLVVPEKHHDATLKVVSDSKNLLMRYFVGIIGEILGVMGLITLGLWIFGIKNALLIGFFGAVMNIIPYLGPVIGTLIGTTLGITATLATGAFDQLLPVVAKILGVFLVANFIDNNILIPVIYSRSVKSHPLEIYFVIIIGGSLAGLPGMILAVPVYTVLRVIAKEFFQRFRIVKKITAAISSPATTGSSTAKAASAEAAETAPAEAASTAKAASSS